MFSKTYIFVEFISAVVAQSNKDNRQSNKDNRQSNKDNRQSNKDNRQSNKDNRQSNKDNRQSTYMHDVGLIRNVRIWLDLMLIATQKVPLTL